MPLSAVNSLSGDTHHKPSGSPKYPSTHSSKLSRISTKRSSKKVVPKNPSRGRTAESFRYPDPQQIKLDQQNKTQAAQARLDQIPKQPPYSATSDTSPSASQPEWFVAIQPNETWNHLHHPLESPSASTWASSDSLPSTTEPSFHPLIVARRTQQSCEKPSRHSAENASAQTTAKKPKPESAALKTVLPTPERTTCTSSRRNFAKPTQLFVSKT